MGEEEIVRNDTRYGMINSMILCKEVSEGTTLLELASDFYAYGKLNEEMFRFK